MVQDVEMREMSRHAVVGEKFLGDEGSERDVLGFDSPREGRAETLRFQSANGQDATEGKGLKKDGR